MKSLAVQVAEHLGIDLDSPEMKNFKGLTIFTDGDIHILSMDENEYKEAK